MFDLIIIVHYVALNACHALIIYVAYVPKLKLLNATTITIDYYWFAGVGCVEITLIEHVFDSKEFQLRNVSSYLSMF